MIYIYHDSKYLQILDVRIIINYRGDFQLLSEQLVDCIIKVYYVQVTVLLEYINISQFIITKHFYAHNCLDNEGCTAFWCLYKHLVADFNTDERDKNL